MFILVDYWLNTSPIRQRDWIFRHVVKNKFPASHEWLATSYKWGILPNFYPSWLTFLCCIWNFQFSTRFFINAEIYILHKDMILLQKKNSPMHNAQCGCKGYLPLSPKRFLSCWMMNGTTFFEVTALIFFICLSIVENNYFSIFLKYSKHIHILRVVWFSLLIIWMEK